MKIGLVSLGALSLSATVYGNAFRVTPYVQRPAKDAMSVLWLTESDAQATIRWWPADGTPDLGGAATTTPEYCSELSYTQKDRSEATKCPSGPILSLPYQHRVRITGLRPATSYNYQVTLDDGKTYSNTFHTAPDRNAPVRFIAYSDCETEPESTGKKDTYWTDPRTGQRAPYLVDQTEGFASNIVRMVERKPDFVVIAGDLAQFGYEQRDWDEFWRHQAGVYNDPAGSIPLLASPGNHDVLNPETGDSGSDGGTVGMARWKRYFDFEPNNVEFPSVTWNGTTYNYDRNGLFHRQDYGRVTVICLDSNNGDDADPEKDSCLYLYAKGSGTGIQPCICPDFNPGSPQFNWFTNQLADAQSKGQFIFVSCHHMPYSVGYHNRINGVSYSGYVEPLSARALRVLTPYMIKYGVTAWIAGHDEIMEHSRVTGKKTLPDGTEVDSVLNLYDVGNSGDGLRGGGLGTAADPYLSTMANPYEVFRAYKDAPGVFDDQGNWIDGGTHYGHLEINVATNAAGRWQATLTPVYVFVNQDAQGNPQLFERREFNDVTVIEGDDYQQVDDPPAEVSSVTWEIESDVADGTVASGAHAVVPNAEGLEGYDMQVIRNTMTWRKDPAPRFLYPDALSAVPCRAFSNSLAVASNASYGYAGLSLTNAPSKLALTNDFTLECYLRVDAGSPQWSRLIEMRRAEGLNQYLNGPEASFGFILQQSTAAAEGGTIKLILRADTQSPVTNRNEVGGGFNANRGEVFAKVGEWFHWAMAYNAATLTVNTWVNGRSQTTSVLPRGLQFDDVDGCLVFGEKMTGAIGYIKYTPKALTTVELLPNAAASMDDAIAGPVRGWWRFENGVNGALVEPNTVASLVNPGWWSVQQRSQKVNYTNEVPSIHQNLFMGDDLLVKGNTGSVVVTNGYLQMTHTRAAMATSFTAECFFRDLGCSGQFGTMLQRTRADVTYTDESGAQTAARGMSAWFLTMGRPGLRLRFDTVPREGVKPVNGVNWNQCYDGKINVKDGKWHHAALTYDGATRTGTLYIDYVKDGSMVTAYPVPVEEGSFLIGINNANATRALDMEIDEVRFTAEVLPPEKFLRFRGNPAMSIYIR